MKLLPYKVYNTAFNRPLLGRGLPACTPAVRRSHHVLTRVSAPARASLSFPIFSPIHIVPPHNKAFGFRAWCSICVPLPAEEAELPCKALRPARTWGSRGTCRWSGCSIRSRRSWSIRRWRSTPGRPVTREHPKVPSFQRLPSPAPRPLPLPSCCGSEGGRASSGA